MRSSHRKLIAAIAFIAATLIFSATANASPVAKKASLPTAQQELNKQLARAPGGKQISPVEISYNNGKVVMVLSILGKKISTDARDRVAETKQVTQDAKGVTQPAAVYYWYGCPYGNVTHWYCFYQNSNFNGTPVHGSSHYGWMLEFQDCSSSGYENLFSSYGFQKQASSWVNTSSHFIQVYGYGGTSAGDWLWSEHSNEAGGGVPPGANDNATDSVCYN